VKAEKEFATSKQDLLEAAMEVEEHVRGGAPLPTDRQIVVESFDKYIIVHASFGEIVNRTLGSVFDSVLSDHEIIIGWWNDGYRILIEARHKLSPQELDSLCRVMFNLSDDDVDRAFNDYLEAKFPFSYKMRFVAQRFGALPRGKTMGPKREAELVHQFSDTPVYDETLREAMIEKVDFQKTREIMSQVRNGTIKVATVYRVEKPTPLAYHILEKFSDISELMAPEKVLLSNIEKMKKAIEARMASLLCMHCNEWEGHIKIRSLPEQPECEKCGSRLLALLYPGQNTNHLHNLLRKRLAGEELFEDELRELTQARRTADLVLSYGKKAIAALEVKGVGPETASRILGKMHAREAEFYMDLLKAKIQYLRTRQYWDDRERKEK
jgi:ATP-dependent Lhr-like helicase